MRNAAISAPSTAAMTNTSRYFSQKENLFIWALNFDCVFERNCQNTNQNEQTDLIRDSRSLTVFCELPKIQSVIDEIPRSDATRRSRTKLVSLALGNCMRRLRRMYCLSCYADCPRCSKVRVKSLRFRNTYQPCPEAGGFSLHDLLFCLNWCSRRSLSGKLPRCC